jgi:hypothetical protein
LIEPKKEIKITRIGAVKVAVKGNFGAVKGSGGAVILKKVAVKAW